MYKRIVVPLDGSDLAEQAIDTAQEMAGIMEGTIHLIRVVDHPAASFTGMYGAMLEERAMTEEQREDGRAQARAYLDEVARAIEGRGVVTTTEVRYGVAIQELVDAMQPDDLYVLASHGRSGMARWFLGSVAEEITRHATVPVLLVRTRAASIKGRSSEHAARTA